jgi:hypothetical protein
LEGVAVAETHTHTARSEYRELWFLPLAVVEFCLPFVPWVHGNYHENSVDLHLLELTDYGGRIGAIANMALVLHYAACAGAFFCGRLRTRFAPLLTFLTGLSTLTMTGFLMALVGMDHGPFSLRSVLGAYCSLVFTALISLCALFAYRGGDIPKPVDPVRWRSHYE